MDVRYSHAWLPHAPTSPSHLLQSDVDEALRLMKMSKASLYDDAGAERAVDPISQVFSRIRQHAERTKRDSYSWADLLDFLGTSFKVGVLCWGCVFHYAPKGRLGGAHLNMRVGACMHAWQGNVIRRL